MNKSLRKYRTIVMYDQIDAFLIGTSNAKSVSAVLLTVYSEFL